MTTTRIISMDALRRIGDLVDNVVNVEECLCESMTNGKCLYHRALDVQDEIVKLIMESRS